MSKEHPITDAEVSDLLPYAGRLIAVLASPIMPGMAERLWVQLGIPEPLSAQRVPEASRWGLVKPGTKTTKGESLFPRIED